MQPLFVGHIIKITRINNRRHKLLETLEEEILGYTISKSTNKNKKNLDR